MYVTVNLQHPCKDAGRKSEYLHMVFKTPQSVRTPHFSRSPGFLVPDQRKGHRLFQCANFNSLLRGVLRYSGSGYTSKTLNTRDDTVVSPDPRKVKPERSPKSTDESYLSQRSLKGNTILILGLGNVLR